MYSAHAQLRRVGIRGASIHPVQPVAGWRNCGELVFGARSVCKQEVAKKWKKPAGGRWTHGLLEVTKYIRRHLLSRFWHYHRLGKLNYCVRDGNRCGLSDMVAGKKPTGSVRTSRLTICGCGYQWQPIADGRVCVGAGNGSSHLRAECSLPSALPRPFRGGIGALDTCGQAFAH